MLSRNQSSGQRRTQVKTVRIDAQLNSSLEKIARHNNMTENALISSALTRFVEWDQQTEGYGFVSIPADLYKELLYTDSGKQIEEIGSEMGPRMLKEILQFWFRRVNLNSFIEYVSLLSKYSGIAKADVNKEGNEYIMTYRHQLGERWSRFVSSYYGESLAKLFGAEPKVEVSGNQVIIRWKAT